MGHSHIPYKAPVRKTTLKNNELHCFGRAKVLAVNTMPAKFRPRCFSNMALCFCQAWRRVNQAFQEESRWGSPGWYQDWFSQEFVLLDGWSSLQLIKRNVGTQKKIASICFKTNWEALSECEIMKSSANIFSHPVPKSVFSSQKLAPWPTSRTSSQRSSKQFLNHFWDKSSAKPMASGEIEDFSREWYIYNHYICMYCISIYNMCIIPSS